MGLLRKNVGWMVVLVALCSGGAASAQRYYYPAYQPEYSPIAFNAWAGPSIDFASCANCGGYYGTSYAYLGADLGVDVGFRLTRRVALVGLAEYSPLFGSIGTVDLFSLGGGLRFSPSPFTQFLFALSYSETNYSGNNQSGFGAHFYAFFPLGFGFGPYFGAVYRRFYDDGGNPSTDIFNLSGGVSYSF